MKWRQFMSAMLAAAMIFTSVPAVNVAAAVDEDALIASYDFDEETLENSVTGEEAKAIVTGLSAYNGTVTYGDGRDGGKSLRLGNYGLELDLDNLGTDFTISTWMKLSGTYQNNQSGFFLGYHSPENWLGLAGAGGTNGKIWGRDGGYTEFGNYNIGTEWHNYIFVGNAAGVKVYIDGVLFANAEGFTPLAGTNQDIYVGVNNWDPEFNGFVDDIKVFDTTLTEADIQELNKDAFESMLQNALDAITEEDLLGNNESADAVKLDLNLIKSLAGGTITWTSSNPDAIAADGTVFNGDKEVEVTMTATLTSGILEVEKDFTFKVLPLDKSSLNELIAKAESIDLAKYTDESAELLAAVTKAAKEVNRQDAVEIAKSEIYYALTELKYKDEYRDPFSFIDSAFDNTFHTMAAGVDDITIFELPEAIADYVSVEYYSSDETVVTFEDGKISSLKDGRATAVALVTADYNGYKEDYTTIVVVGDNANISEAAYEAQKVNEAEKEDVLKDPTEGPLYIKESSIHQLLTKDFVLPEYTTVDGKEADIEYSLENADENYVTLEDRTLKINRPYGGEGNYTFVVTADIYAGDDVITQQFPFTIAEGTTKDTMAGYVYLCFGNRSGADVQQVHMFLSEDGLNWTAVNGFNPVFEVGTDYAHLINEAGTHNYTLASGADISETVSGDASVLFPFEGKDHGIRDPYILRGAREDDKDKVWILATDLNTMSSHYGGNLSSNRVGNWGTMSSQGSTSIFVYETEDFINWERRYIDVGSEIGAGAAWAPEAVYNPEKDNYLVYWSCRVSVDGRARNRVYCNETEDFVTFGPTKLYEQEPNYADWGRQLSGNDGYGNIDTSQLWVADEDGNPYGTLFRVVKDETDNHIELKSAKTVLDPDVDYDDTEPTRITPYTFNGVERKSTSDLSGLNDYQKAEVVWNWFKDESTGDHFTHIKQTYMESRNESNGAFEGATMFKFNDRDEWCVMIDNYSSSSIRYEPYVSYDLSQPDSISKVTSGYGRTGGDVGCHGGMMPITADEYNTIIDVYNSNPNVSNYHPIDYIELDKRPYEALAAEIEAKLAEDGLEEEVKAVLEENLLKVDAMIQQDMVDPDAIEDIKAQVEALTSEKIYIGVDGKVVALEVGASEDVASSEGTEGDVEWYSIDEAVATVDNGTITAVGNGSTFVVVRSGRNAVELIKVLVGTEGLPYEDVAAGDWFYESVAYTYYQSLMTGMDATHFGPYGQLSRAQFALILYRMEGEPAVNTDKSFGDIAGDEWYGDAVLWAAEAGIVTGYQNGNFGPADNITREQMAVMMYRYANYLGKDTTNKVSYDEFADAASVSEFATDAMQWVVAEGIITGKENGTKLDPQGNTARCEAAAIIQRFLEN